jgi:nucleoside-diphosphate-sugar epimerase
MKIILLGGHGFIGSYVTRELLDRGHECTVIDQHKNYMTFPGADQEYSRVISDRLAMLASKSYLFIQDDFDHVDLDTMPKPDVIINLASCPNAQLVNADPMSYRSEFIDHMIKLGNYCADWDIKLVYASSSMVYGNFDEPAQTSQICQPTDMYGAFKLCGEHILNSLARHRGLRHVNLRPSAVYGPRDMTVRVISRYAKQLITQGCIEVADPDSRVDFTYVEDLAQLIAQAVELDSATGRTLNVTRGRSRRLLEAANVILGYFGSGYIKTVPGNGFYPKRGSLDRQETMSVLNYESKMDIEQGITEYLNWLTKN